MAAEALLLFTVVGAVAGMDLARHYPLTAAGIFLAAIHSAFIGALAFLGIEAPTGLWWANAILLPASFWLISLELMSRARRDMTIHLGLFAFQSFWFATAVYVLWASGGRPGLALALGLGVTYGVPLEVGLWATGQSKLADRRVRWQILAVCLLAGLLMATLAYGASEWSAAAFFFLAGIWGLVRYGHGLDIERAAGDEEPVEDPHAWIEDGY